MSQTRVWLAVATTLGCGGGWPEVIDVREMGGSFGSPEISRVRDLGNPDLPAHGVITGAEPDGVATPGELLLIEGSGFGRQPTVMVGGRPAAVVARTSGGGIVVRTPTALAPGSAPVDVSTAKGRGEASLPIRRYALIAVGEKNHLHVLEVGRDEAHPFGHPLEIANAQLVRFAFDGSAAYAVTQGTGSARLYTIDMTAPEGPRVVATQDIPERRIVAAATAEAAPILALVGESQLLLYDLGATKRPARWPPLALSEAVTKAQVAQVALDPEGKTLALLTAHGNQVRFYDVSNPRDKKLVTTVDVLPDQRTALVRDMQFSTDGETLWVVSGDNALSLGAGPQPTRLTAIRLLPPRDNQEGPRVVSVWRTMAVPGAAAPLGLAVSRGQPLASGTTIRIPPEKAAVFITGVQSALFQLAGVALATPAGVKKADALLRPIAQPGMIVRANINGGGGPLFATPQVLSSVDLTPDAQVLIATACRAVPGGDGQLDLSFGVVSAALWGKPSPKFIPLEKVSAEQFRPPFRLGQVRIQP
ncbi:MAG TPA: IPT/TIG domain-containing protein [Polyangia bacterium]|nr:IPT/TIG domain-containing protein [Polyangia bacterium]